MSSHDDPGDVRATPPNTPEAFKGVMVALARHLPSRLGQMRQSGKSIRALTHTTHKR